MASRIPFPFAMAIGGMTPENRRKFYKLDRWLQRRARPDPWWRCLLPPMKPRDLVLLEKAAAKYYERSRKPKSSAD